MAGRGHLRAAGEHARRVEQAVCTGVARDDAGVEPGGGRSSGVHGNRATEHGMRIWWVCSAPGIALSAVARSVWTKANQNDDGDKSGAGEVSV